MQGEQRSLSIHQFVLLTTLATRRSVYSMLLHAASVSLQVDELQQAKAHAFAIANDGVALSQAKDKLLEQHKERMQALVQELQVYHTKNAAQQSSILQLEARLCDAQREGAAANAALTAQTRERNVQHRQIMQLTNDNSSCAQP
jgi:hypothetical protein